MNSLCPPLTISSNQPLSVCSSHQYSKQVEMNYDLIVKSHYPKSIRRDRRKVRSDHNGLWITNFQKLLAFQEKNNHCIVPCIYDADPSLARWVKRQRHHYYLLSKGKPSPLRRERIEMLNKIGFVWHAKEALWQERFAELLEFKKKYGHCFVPTSFPSNQPLATWVKCQRRQYKLYESGRSSFITTDRIMMLEECGFEWNPNSVRLSKAKNVKTMLCEPEENTRWLDIILSDLASDDSILSSNSSLGSLMEDPFSDISSREENTLSDLSSCEDSCDDSDSCVSLDVFL